MQQNIYIWKKKVNMRQDIQNIFIWIIEIYTLNIFTFC